MADETLDATVETGRTRKIDSSWDVARDVGAPIFYLNDQNAISAGAFTIGSFHVFQAAFRVDISVATVSPINTAKILLPLPNDGITVTAAGHSIRIYGVPWDGVLGETAWHPQSDLVANYDLLSEILIADMVENTVIEFEGAAIADWVNNGAVGDYVGFLVAHTIQFQGTPTSDTDEVDFELGAQLFISDEGGTTPVDAQAAVGFESVGPRVTQSLVLNFESGPGDPVSQVAAIPLEWDAVYAASVGNPFSGDSDLVSGAVPRSFSEATAVVPNDSADLPGGPSFLVADGPGHVVVGLGLGQMKVFAVLAGQVIQFPVRRVYATGTTATGIKALR